MVVKSDQLKRAWVTLFLRDECVCVCVCSCSWVCVCVCEKHLGYICGFPSPHLSLQTHPPEITGVALECVVRILSGIFHLMERTDLHSLRFESKHLHSQEEIANVVLLQRLKHKNTPREKKPIQITSFIPKTQRFWFLSTFLNTHRLSFRWWLLSRRYEK